MRATEIYKDYIVIVWDEPESDGGSPITEYIVEKRDSRKTAFFNAGNTRADDRNLRCTKLIEGNSYHFQVFAENDIGRSDPAVTDEPITARLPFDPPGQPINVKVNDVTKTSCKLTWEAPEFDGGSPIKGYYVERLSGTRWIKVNKTPTKSLTMDFSDLMEGSDYEFRVSAENEAGIGKPSETTGKFVAKNPYDVPGRPEAPLVDDITPEEAEVSWTAPDDDGGSPVTNYVLEMRAVGDVRWKPVNKNVTETKLTVTGLKEGTKYEFRVAAENKAGVGEASKPSKPAQYGEHELD